MKIEFGTVCETCGLKSSFKPNRERLSAADCDILLDLVITSDLDNEKQRRICNYLFKQRTHGIRRLIERLKVCL